MCTLQSAFFFWMFVLKPVSSNLAVPSTIKGLRGHNVVLQCVPPDNGPTLPTISWSKTVDRVIKIVATSVSGVHHFSDSSLRDRASLNGANLTINSLLISDEGTYSCSVIAIGRPQETETLVLTVTAAPSISAYAVSLPSIESSGLYVAALCRAFGGKPKATIRWKNQVNEIQQSRVSVNMTEYGSYNVESSLLVKPGLLGRLENSTLPVSHDDKVQMFSCHVIHEDISKSEPSTRKVTVNLLYPPVAHISLLANRLTCQVDGNPTPSLKWFLPNGEVLLDRTSVMVNQITSDNGRYVCIASSELKPDAINTLDVQKAKDLPTLFRNLLQVDSSVPITASGYKIDCSADVRQSSSGVYHVNRLSFQWSKDGRYIENGLYNISMQRVRVLPTWIRLTSTLSFPNIVKGRDDALFQCRFLNTSKIDGFVTAVERAVKVSVDYPPVDEDILLKSTPRNSVVVEGSTLILSCLAKSMPSSTYEWYFNGSKIATGSEITITNIDRYQAGRYLCMAYNYVPGSARAYIIVTVHYPPSQVLITKISDGLISCKSESGSVPPPIYTWIYPNLTRTSGNHSVLKLPSPTPGHPVQYVCLASNTLRKTSNATFVQFPPVEARIGALAVSHFIAVMVVSILLVVVMVVFVTYTMCRRLKSKKATQMRVDETFKQYLQFSEKPDNGLVLTDIFRDCPSSSTGTAQSRMKEQKMKMSEREKPIVKAVRYSDNKSLGYDNKTVKENASISASSLSYSDVGGSSVEIMGNESLPSSGNNIAEGTLVKKPNYDILLRSTSPIKTTNSKQNNFLQDYEDIPRGSTLPCAVRLANIRQDMIRQMHAGQRISPLEYVPRNSLPRISHNKMPLHVHQSPASLVFPGYSGFVYDDTWHPGIPHCRMQENVQPKREPQTSLTFLKNETTSTSTTASEDYLHGVRSSRPRSMSLSASSSCTESESAEDRSSTTSWKNHDLLTEVEKTVVKSTRTSKAISPYDSGNDTVKSTSATSKKQSLTLV